MALLNHFKELFLLILIYHRDPTSFHEHPEKRIVIVNLKH